MHPSPPPRSWSLLALLATAQFMVVLDITIVNVALPSIGRALHFAAADLSWVVTAYILCSGGLLLVGGRLADLVGRRTTFLAGLALFTLASLTCGLAGSPGLLVGARAVQGAGAALMTPSALSLVTTHYTGPQRATALALWGAIASAGAGVGVLLGGILTTTLSWEWVFLVNVPVGVATGALAINMVPRGARAPADRGLDLPGAVTVVAGLATLVYALTQAPEHGWGSPRTLGLLALALALLIAFAAIEARVRRPLVPASLIRIPTLAGGSLMMLATTGILAGAFFLNSLYLQRTLGWSALSTGLAFLPLVVAIGLGVHGAQHLIQRHGTRVPVVAGLLLTAAGTFVLALAPDRASYAPDLLPGFVAFGLGLGLAFPCLSITALSDVDHERAGLASGLMSTAHEVGAALGVAVLSAVAAGAAAPAAGYGDACLATAVAAVVLAVVAAARFPAVRPAPGHAIAMH